MDKSIRALCNAKRDEILEKYYGRVIHENVVEEPQVLDEHQYNNDTPFTAEADMWAYLVELKERVFPEDIRPLEDIIDRPVGRRMVNLAYEESVKVAYRNAKERSLWERITGSNKSDVAFYKGLLKQYTEELLEHMITDFLESGNTIKRNA